MTDSTPRFQPGEEACLKVKITPVSGCPPDYADVEFVRYLYKDGSGDIGSARVPLSTLRPLSSASQVSELQPAWEHYIKEEVAGQPRWVTIADCKGSAAGLVYDAFRTAHALSAQAPEPKPGAWVTKGCEHYIGTGCTSKIHFFANADGSTIIPKACPYHTAPASPAPPTPQPEPFLKPRFCAKCGGSTDDAEIEMIDNKDGARTPRLFCKGPGGPHGGDHEFEPDAELKAKIAAAIDAKISALQEQPGEDQEMKDTNCAIREPHKHEGALVTERERLERDVQISFARCEQAQKQRNELHDALDNSRALNEPLRVEIATLTRERDEARATIERLEKACGGLVRQSTSLQSQLDAVTLARDGWAPMIARALAIASQTGDDGAFVPSISAQRVARYILALDTPAPADLDGKQSLIPSPQLGEL